MGFRAEARRRLQRLHRTRRSLKLSAVLLSVLVLTGGGAAAWAAVGSGGSGTTSGGTTGPNDDVLYIYDNADDLPNPDQGWGDDSIAYAISAIEDAKGTFTNLTKNVITSNCQDAIQNAIDRDETAAKARVVLIAATIMDYGGEVDTWGTNAPNFQARFNDNWTGINAPSYLENWDANDINAVKNEADARITAIGDGGANPSNICVAVNEHEPQVNYSLSVATQAQRTPNGVNWFDGQSLIEGNSSWLRDRVKLTRSGSTLDEKVKVASTLAYKASGGFGGIADHTLVKTRDPDADPPTGVDNHGSDTDDDNDKNTVWHDLDTFTYAAFGHTSGWKSGYYWFNTSVSGAHLNDSPVTYNGDGVASERWRVLNRHDAALELSSQGAQALVSGWDQTDLNTGSTVTQNVDGSNTVMAGSTVTLTDQVRVKLKAGAENQNLDTNSDGKFDSFHFAVETRLTVNGQSRVKSLNYRGYHTSGTQCATLNAPEIDGDVDVNGCATFGFAPSDFGWSVWPGGSFTFESHLSAVGSKGEGRNAANVVDSCGDDSWLVRSSNDQMYAVCLAKGDWTNIRAASENGYAHHQLQLQLATNVTQKSRNDGLLSNDTVTLSLVDDTDNAAHNRYKATMSGIENLTVPVRGSYWWSPTAGADGDTVAANAKKVCDAETRNVTVGAAGDWKPAQGSYAFNVTRANAGGTCANVDDVRLGTGYYTWVWHIAHADVTSVNSAGVQVTNTHSDNTFTYTVEAEKLFDWAAQVTDTKLGAGASLTDGWRPATEQTLMRTPWTMSINKHGRIGKEDGSWSPMPAKNASFTLTEIEQATATSGNTSLIHSASMKTGGQSVNVVTNTDGQLTINGLRDLEPGETRYYRLVENGVDHPMTVPGWDPVLGQVVRDAGWVVTVGNTNGTRGVSRLTFDGYDGATQAGTSTPWNETDHLIDKRRQTGATLALVTGTGIPKNLDADTAATLGVSKGSGVQNRPTAVLQDLGDTQLANVMTPVTGGIDATAMAVIVATGTLLVGGIVTLLLRRKQDRTRTK